jgi:hypothetical protein
VVAVSLDVLTIILTEPFPVPVGISVIALKVRGFMLLSIVSEVACTY